MESFGLPRAYSGKSGGRVAVLATSSRRAGDIRVRAITPERRMLSLAPSDFPAPPRPVGRVDLPTPFAPDTLPDFVDALRQVSLHSIHHHFIEARLRLKRMSNDFSNWLEQEVGLRDTALAIERIDIYTNTLEGVRQQIARIVGQALN